MTCFGWGLRRTAPAHGTSRNELVPSKPPKINGWSWPPQALQVIGWLVYCYLAIVGFGIYIPLLPPPWSYATYAVSFTQKVVQWVEYVSNTARVRGFV